MLRRHSFAWSVAGLLLLEASTGSAGAAERYGFESGAQGWEKSADTSSQAVTSVAPSSAWAAAGTNSLRLDCDLRESPAALQKGEAFVDMQNFPPYGSPYPADLDGVTVTLAAFCPPGSAGTNSEAWAHHLLAILVKDTNGYSLYDSGDNIVAGNTTQLLSLVVSTNVPQPYGYKDPLFNPKAIRYVGLKYEMKLEGGPYQGPVYIDAVSFDPVLPPLNIVDERYDFEQDSEGFEASTFVDNRAITSVVRSTAVAAGGAGSLQLNVQMIGSNPSYDDGEASVDMANFCPSARKFRPTSRARRSRSSCSALPARAGTAPRRMRCR